MGAGLSNQGNLAFRTAGADATGLLGITTEIMYSEPPESPHPLNLGEAGILENAEHGAFLLGRENLWVLSQRWPNVRQPALKAVDLAFW